MSSLNQLVNLNGITPAEVGVEILDFVFGKHCILLDDLGALFGVGTGIPAPIIGFEYEVPNNLELLKLRYSEFPYMDRTAMVNGYMMDPTRNTLRACRAIGIGHSFLLNFALNQAILALLEKYAQNCGTFTIITAWGVRRNCLLEKLTGFKTGDKDPGGYGFEFQFYRPNVPKDSIIAMQNTYLQAITGGTAL